MVKAVHLETVFNISTPAFLAALDRFVAHLANQHLFELWYNFVGTSKQLRQFMFNVTRRDHLTCHLMMYRMRC